MPDIEMVRVNAPSAAEDRAYLKKNDLLFARRSLTLEGAGKCAIVAEVTTPTTWESSIIRARVDANRASAPFLYYYFRSPQGRRQMETIVEQVAAAGIRLTDLAKLNVPSPPLPEQQAIAEVLGALDDKIAANTALAATAERIASATYDAMTRTWPRVLMSTVLDPILGGTPARAREDYWAGGDQLWISARDITSAPSHVVVDTAEKITSAALAETKAKALPAGSVILTARGTVGEVGRLARPASFNQSCYGFRPDVLPPSLLYFAVLQATERAKAVAHGSVFDTITKATFDHLHLAWDEVQAPRAEVQIAPLLQVVATSIEENRTLAATRDALLPQLMSGKLRVRDAEAAASEAGA
ncbi:restriction endonuclease subunit S [Demequina sediminis]|uniref:restriction endonuclease subunit S n=1 Tax=Demequina sediminis TaxID=1930058 RepID=UPI002573F7F9|nr:restriction endonuclease subunit S [Demequina sediminis]